MTTLQAGIVGFDITPRIHPTMGAWGTTPSMTEVDMPLLSRCIALAQDGRTVLWFGSDLVGESVPGTDQIRGRIAEAVGLPVERVIWSTSQTHSSGALPGSRITGSSVCDLSRQDAVFGAKERERFDRAVVEAAREAIRRLQPAAVWAGTGFCDSMSYNTRFPMPDGGVKFSRDHAEGLRGGKFHDPTISLLRFDDRQGKALGAVFNFCAHPATMINDRMISPDWVGTARQCVEESVGGAPAMFVQGMCGDVNCRYMFGTPAQARLNGRELGEAAARAMRRLVPVRPGPLRLAWKTIELPCRPMYDRDEIRRELDVRRAYVEGLEREPRAVWVAGINLPEFFDATQKAALVRIQIEYLEEAQRLVDAGAAVRKALPITLGALRIGDAAALLSPGENFTRTGQAIRLRSPFVHTLVCGDTNGLFGYIGDDADINRGGYETDTFWKMLYIGGFRLAPAHASVDRIIRASGELLEGLLQGNGG